MSRHYTDTTFHFADCTMTSTGEEYSGSHSVTRTGLECQRWDAQTPHQHSFTDPSIFYGTESISELENYCRKPQGDKVLPWCFTIDPQQPWQYCDIPYCR